MSVKKELHFSSQFLYWKAHPETPVSEQHSVHTLKLGTWNLSEASVSEHIFLKFDSLGTVLKS